MKINENYSSRETKIKDNIPRPSPRAGHDIVFFPEIRLSGKWLQDICFNSGQAVTVQHEKDKIVIISADQPNEPGM